MEDGSEALTEEVTEEVSRAAFRQLYSRGAAVTLGELAAEVGRSLEQVREAWGWRAPPAGCLEEAAGTAARYWESLVLGLPT